MYEAIAVWVGTDGCNRYTVESYFLRKDIAKQKFYEIYVGFPFCNCIGYNKALFCSKIRLRCIRKRLFEYYKHTEKEHQGIKFRLKEIKIRSVA